MSDESVPDGIVRTDGGAYVLLSDSHLSRWIEEHGTLEVAEGEIGQFARHIPDGGTVVDAGASLGDHAATYARLVGKGGTVFAFEPHPLTFQALGLNMRKRPNVIVQNAALSDDGLPAKMTLDENIGASHISNDGKVEVKTVTMDHALSGLRRFDFLHLDVEGKELSALRGGREVLTKFHPAIVLEINHGCLARYGLKECDVLAELGALGYKWSELYPGHDSSLPQRDILAVKK